MEIGTVKQIDIDHEMRAAYLDYAMSVITARALPDVRDGLKPVQRRILYAMNELSLSHTSAYKKSARIVGEVLGKYHPHGDAPVYETMVRMAQDFSLRYLLVDGQGNFGSVDGDPPAAMRYTEARLTAVAEELLADLDKNTVDFVDNFDATLKEPSVLPARLPNLLLNGASGIAVGMATNIPPHNLREVADAIIFILDQFQRAVNGGIPFEVAQARVHGRPLDRATLVAVRKTLTADFKALVTQECEAKLVTLDKAPRNKEQRDELEQSALLDVIDQVVDVPAERLVEFIIGPDFPTGGIIIGRKGITDAYTTGHGRIVIRAKAFIENRGSDRSTIIITELPYQVNKATLVERIADLVRDKRIEGVSELRDESDRQGMRVVIELRRDVQANQLLNNLFKLTTMQSAFSVNLLALVDGEPRVLNIKRLLQHYIDYRHQVLTRRTQFDLDKARARAHILEGLKIALDNLDEVINTIRNSPDADVARTRLMKRFKLSELQAQAILDMQLRRLAALERKKIEQELAEMLKLIAQLEDLLAHPIKIYGLIKQDLVDLKQKYGDDRRTKIREEEAEDFTAEDLIADEEAVVAVSGRGYVKRVPADSYRAQPRRPGRAVTAVVSKEQDPATLLVNGSSHDTIIFLSNVGKAYAMKCHEIPAADRQARGVPLSNFLSTAMAEEHIVGMVAVREQDGTSVTLVTHIGEIKRVMLAELVGARTSGINVMALESKDEVIWAGATLPGQDIVIVTAQGKAIRFEPETEVRASGRGSGGVRAIKLDDEDRVVAADLVDDNASTDGALVVLTRLAMGKRSALKEYSPQGRGGGGLMTAAISEKTGPLVAARIVAPGDDLVFVSALGQVIRKPFEEINALARAHRGVRLIELGTGDKPVAILRLRPDRKAAGAAPPEEGSEPAKPSRKKKVAAEPGSIELPLELESAQAGEAPLAKAAAAAKPAAEQAGKAKKEAAAPTAAAKKSATAEAPTKAAPKPAPAEAKAPAKKARPTAEVAAPKAATTKKTVGAAPEGKRPQAKPAPKAKSPAAHKPEQPAAPKLRSAKAPAAGLTALVAAKLVSKPQAGGPEPSPVGAVPPSPLRSEKRAAPAAPPAAKPSPARPTAAASAAASAAKKEGAPAKKDGKTKPAPAPAAKSSARATPGKAETKPGVVKSTARGPAPEPVAPARPRATGSASKAPTKPAAAAPAPTRSAASKPPAAKATAAKPSPEKPAAAKSAPKRAGKDDIVIRTGGKTTIVPRSDIFPGEAGRPPETQTGKKDESKARSQVQLPLWGEQPKKG